MGDFVDACSHDLGERISANVCIVGAGAAGLTLARELGKRVSGVVLIESGSLNYDLPTQGLYAEKQRGIPYFNLSASRLRFFGGTTNHWAGYCRPNDPIDYEGREAIGLPPWPVSIAELTPFIARAAASLGIETKLFDSKSFFEHIGDDAVELIDARSEHLVTKVFQLAQDIRLGKRYRAELMAEPKLRVLLNLNATHVQLAPDAKSVASIRFRTVGGRSTEVVAKHYVLACHAIENARLLLTSNDVMTPGIGNASDHVGRYFMDHVQVMASRFRPASHFPVLYNMAYARARHLNANLSFSDAKLRELNILQYYCRFCPVYTSTEALDALQQVRADWDEPGTMKFLRDLGTVAANLRGISMHMLAARGANGGLLGNLQPEYYELDHRIEQAPNPHSRVLISRERNELGSLKAELDWQLSEPDFRTFRTGQSMVAKELTALGYGHCELEDMSTTLVKQRAKGHYHNIGTTRMSHSSADGVVDANCRVHGVGNLFVAGSSVFPTAGYSGPTMMVIALSMRLADHLAGLQQG